MKHLKLFAALCCTAMLFAACDKSNEPDNPKMVITGTENGYNWVNLGLPSGLKWATCNVGATAPEEYGNYYAWGETAPQDNYYWDTYKLTTDGGTTFTKYNTDSSFGTVDNKTTLDSEDDAATVNWGGKWRMPTDDEWTELCENCAWRWTTLNGVNGYKVTSETNGNTIFLPAAGYRDSGSLYDAGHYGYYWSSALSTGSPYNAWNWYFNSDIVSRPYDSRCLGQSVRPVVK